MYDSIINTLILVTCIGCVILDYYICKYVRAEYEESKDLNNKLDKVYKSRKKKNTLVKALINTTVNEEGK